MAVELHDEVIVEILSMLPSKSLLRCQLVCKSWLNLINSTEFKLMHLGNFNQLNPRYFICRLDYSTRKEWFRVHLDDEAFTFDRNLQFPFRIWYRIIGCCNGVVCLDGWSTNPDMVIMWNPSIRRKLTLPLPIFKVIRFEDSLAVLGFGYDKMSDDYKVVRLTYTDVNLARPHAEVYTVKTGIWREVMFPHNLRCFNIHHSRSQIFSDGCVHWIASDQTYEVSHNSIMTFDISTELFGEILLPDDDLVKEHPSTMLISVVGESLAVTCYNYLINMEKMASSTYKVWVMKEYKNPTSWTLIYNMHHPNADMGKPLKLRNKGSMIMESTDEDIIVYDYSGSASCICLGYESKLYCWNYVDKYQESLALLDVGHTVSVSNDEGFDDD